MKERQTAKERKQSKKEQFRSLNAAFETAGIWQGGKTMENSNAKKCNWCVHINTCKFRGSNEYNADSCSFYYTIDVFGDSVFKEIGKKIDILIKILKPKEEEAKHGLPDIMKEPVADTSGNQSK